MKSPVSRIGVAGLIFLAGVFSGALLLHFADPELQHAPTDRDADLARLEHLIAELLSREQVERPPVVASAKESGEEPAAEEATKNLAALADEIRELKRLLRQGGAAVLVEPPEDPLTRADFFYKEGKLAAAVDHYLRFIERSPEDPDAIEIWRKVRLTYSLMKYHSRAAWAQEEIFRRYPHERTYGEVLRMARLKNSSRDHLGAVRYADEALELASDGHGKAEASYWRAELVSDAHGLDEGLVAMQDALETARIFNQDKWVKVCTERIDYLRGKLRE